jgi:hypothetical protein
MLMSKQWNLCPDYFKDNILYMNNVCMSFMRQVYETENNLLTSIIITVLEIIYC